MTPEPPMSRSSTPWAVVPVKSFALAKSRLDHLAGPTRAELARSFFEHVLTAIIGSGRIDRILVATNGDDVAQLARERGCSVIRDSRDTVAAPRGRLGDIVDRALGHIAGDHPVLILMADLPAVTSAEIAELAGAAVEHDVVIAPDRREMGTNALGLSSPRAMATCFGHEDSFLRHLQRARDHGLRAHIQRDPGLALDIDVPGDHRALISRAV